MSLESNFFLFLQTRARILCVGGGSEWECRCGVGVGGVGCILALLPGRAACYRSRECIIQEEISTGSAGSQPESRGTAMALPNTNCFHLKFNVDNVFLSETQCIWCSVVFVSKKLYMGRGRTLKWSELRERMEKKWRHGVEEIFEWM